MTVTIPKAVGKLALWQDAAELSARVARLCESFPAEDRDWLADPLRHAARSAADHIAAGWQGRYQPGVLFERFAAAEADVHEVQTWALLALRHHHLSPRVADDVDRRCEALLDHLADQVHRPTTALRAA